MEFPHAETAWDTRQFLYKNIFRVCAKEVCVQILLWNSCTLLTCWLV